MKLCLNHVYNMNTAADSTSNIIHQCCGYDISCYIIAEDSTDPISVVLSINVSVYVTFISGGGEIAQSLASLSTKRAFQVRAASIRLL